MKPFLKIFLIFNLLISGFSAPAQYPTDCIDSVIICGNSSVNLNVNGIGTQELNNSNTCGSRETNSIWLQVSFVTDGTLGFTLKPNSSDIIEDYDFFVFGPNVACNNLGQAIRCSTTNPSAAGLANNWTGMNSSASDTSEGPGPDGNSFVKPLTVTAGDTFYIVIDRPYGNSGFTLEWTGTAKFSSPPVNASNPLTTPLNLEKCDTDLPYADGFTSFNIEGNTSKIIGLQKDVTVAYYLNDTDANSNTKPLSSPYTNISNPQNIVARITNTITGCFELVDFTLSSNLGPDFKAPSTYYMCDTDEDGNSTNGQTSFDLYSKTSEILNGQDPTSLNITYHESMASATNNSDMGIPRNYYNAVPNQQQLFIRIQDAYNTNCRAITSFDLVINALPLAYNTSLVQCDEDGLKDGRTVFNLTEIKETITGGESDRTVSFYLDKNDAISGKPNTVDSQAFINTTSSQLLYARVSNDDTKCFRIAEVRLEVSTTSAFDAELTHCDDDGIEDGLYTFTLSDANPEVLKGLPLGLELLYYKSYQDALLETDPLPNVYTTTTSYSQTVYARVENSNACYGISEVTLNVFQLPQLETESEMFYCLNTFPERITLYADVTSNGSGSYSYLWSTSETTSEILVNNPGTYSVRVSNGNGCYKDRIIRVLPSNIATISEIKINDAAQNNTVNILVTGEGAYEYALDNRNGIYQDEQLFENVSPGFHTVYVKDKNGCGMTSEKISVIGFPKYFTPNNDAIHDYWQIYGVNKQFQPKTTIYIFDRMGKLLKQLNPLGKGWDGTYVGQPMAPDDYWFSITLQDGRTVKGHFTLKR
ncbi:T9SS type B sorting domain-containing protein [Gelidibacter salicanalis]|uniref:T9SS type B sorting domain-containing protein n=1 Tax=Gelidibacter salicanalis TaxID=291193 RepID=A0A5C7AP88_9FLAO|nr:T9SS type B sorting domain-containing protein [Gelidibacter salicanalis]TXE09489.1 T9SS type B sorting domain-containing protein [Gelidibacter salicanalis]